MTVQLPPVSAFKRDLDEMLAAHFGTDALGGKYKHKATTLHLCLCGLLVLVELLCWYGWSQSSWAATLALPFVFWLVIANVSHDASHFAFSKRPWVNRIGSCASCPIISDSITWYYQHVIMHHTHVNEVEFDVDLQHFAPMILHPADTKVHPAGDSTPADLIKLLMVGLHLNVGVPLFNAGMMSLEMYKNQFHPAIWIPVGLAGHTKYTRLSAFGPISVLSTLLLSAYFRAGFLAGLGFFVVPFFICSLLFILVTQVSHVQPEIQAVEQSAPPKFALRDDDGTLDFWKWQAITSVDYSTDSKFWNFVTGGLNAQALHHCCPHVSACHYQALYPYFEAVCKRHGIVVHKRKSIWHAAYTSLCHVYAINHSPVRPTEQPVAPDQVPAPAAASPIVERRHASPMPTKL